MDRRIAAPKALDKVLEQLVTSLPGEEIALFKTKQKALMFAAALGVHLGRREGLGDRGASTAIRYDIFEKANDDGYIGALGVAETGDLKTLGEDREEECARIFEEYAHAGLKELNRLCFESGADALEALQGLVSRALEVEEADTDLIDPDTLRRLLE